MRGPTRHMITPSLEPALEARVDQRAPNTRRPAEIRVALRIHSRRRIREFVRIRGRKSLRIWGVPNPPRVSNSIPCINNLYRISPPPPYAETQVAEDEEEEEVEVEDWLDELE